MELWRVGVMALWVRRVCKMFLRESSLLAQFTMRCRVCRQVAPQPSHPTVMIDKALNGALLEHNGTSLVCGGSRGLSELSWATVCLLFIIQERSSKKLGAAQTLHSSIINALPLNSMSMLHLFCFAQRVIVMLCVTSSMHFVGQQNL